MTQYILVSICFNIYTLRCFWKRFVIFCHKQSCKPDMNFWNGTMRWDADRRSKVTKMPLLPPESWTVVPGRPYVLLQFFILLLSSRDLRGFSADGRAILPHSRKHVQFYNPGPKIWRPIPPKILRAKNMLNLARFRTFFHFEREYLRNGLF